MLLPILLAILSGGGGGVAAPVYGLSVLREFQQIDTTPVVSGITPDVFVQDIAATPSVHSLETAITVYEVS